MAHWTDDFEHESITDANRVDFNKAMEKFPTQADVSVGYVELQKSAGKPYKLPESVDNLPEAARGEFTSRAQELLGIHYPANVEALSDLDLKLNSADDAPMDEARAAAFKQYCVDEKIPKGIAQKIIGFHNKGQADANKAYTEAVEAQKTEAANKQVAAVNECNDLLATHYGTKEKLEDNTKLLHMAFLNNVGITADEANGLSEFMRDREGATNAVLRKVLINALAPLAKQSNVEGGGDGTPVVPQADPDEGSPSYIAIWGKKKPA